MTENKYLMTRYIVQNKILKDEKIKLLDIGCRGGIDKKWRVLGDYLEAYAIDPILTEIERLQQEEKSDFVKYFACYIGLDNDHPVVQSREGKDFWGKSPWSSLSSWQIGNAIAKKTDHEETKKRQNRWGELKLASQDELYTVDEFIKQFTNQNIDFLKIDVDGADFYALLSGQTTFTDKNILGLDLEVNFYGTDSSTDHTFHNTDRFVKKYNYELFDLDIRRYTRAALPDKFIYNIPAQTFKGSPMQADAFYMKNINFIDKEFEYSWFEPVRLLKMAIIYELYGLNDCAAEILLEYRTILEEILNVDYALDLLTPLLNGKKISYKEYMNTISDNPEILFPKNYKNEH